MVTGNFFVSHPSIFTVRSGIVRKMKTKFVFFASYLSPLSDTIRSTVSTEVSMFERDVPSVFDKWLEDYMVHYPGTTYAGYYKVD